MVQPERQRAARQRSITQNNLNKHWKEQQIKNKGKKFGLKGLTLKPETDLDRKKQRQIAKIEKDKADGKLVMETTPADQGIKIDDVSKEIVLKSKDDQTNEEK